MLRKNAVGRSSRFGSRESSPLVAVAACIAAAALCATLWYLKKSRDELKLYRQQEAMCIEEKTRVEVELTESKKVLPAAMLQVDSCKQETAKIKLDLQNLDQQRSAAEAQKVALQEEHKNLQSAVEQLKATARDHLTVLAQQ